MAAAELNPVHGEALDRLHEGHAEDRYRARKSHSTYLPVELIKEAQAAVFWTRMIPDEPDSFAALVERGLRNEVARLEETYNEGEHFEIPEGKSLRPGPAPGVMKRVGELRRAALEAARAKHEDGVDHVDEAPSEEQDG